MTLTPTREEAAQAALTDRLNDPVVTAALTSLLDRAELIAVLLEGLDQFVARTEVIGDSLVDGISELRSAVGSNPAMRDSGVDLQALAEAGTSLAAVLPRAVPGIVAAVDGGVVEKLVNSGVLDGPAVDQVALLGQGLARGSREFAEQPIAVGGALSVLRLLKDPDINRAISYFATVAKAIGQELAAAPQTSEK